MELDIKGKYGAGENGSDWFDAFAKTKYVEVRVLNNRNALPLTLGESAANVMGRGLLQGGPAGDHCRLLVACGIVALIFPGSLLVGL